MARNELHKFFLGIVLPSMLAIGLFILSIFLVIVPAFEKNIMAKKKEMISELTNTVWSLLVEIEQERAAGHHTLEKAQQLAASRVGRIRYGSEGKDYFWITDTVPTMIMHPYRGELTSSDLSTYADPNGKKLFVEAVRVVNESGEGYIDYMWQWKDDSTRIVPKLSYVKQFKPWGWIVGTGIYLEDAHAEIQSLQKRLVAISMSIVLLIILILLYVIRQSLVIERRRRIAEEELRKSRHKYKSLVEASNEGTLMITDNRVIFSNIKFASLAGYDPAEMSRVSPIQLFEKPWPEIKNMFLQPDKSITLETQLICADQNRKEVVISVSKIDYSGSDGFIVIIKEVSTRQMQELERAKLGHELQTSLLLMNQPIRKFVKPALRVSLETSVRETTRKMADHESDFAFICNEQTPVGILTAYDLGERVVARGLDSSKPVVEIMSSPVRSIDSKALLYEALLMLRKHNISHLAVSNDEGQLSGCISHGDIAGMQQNTVSFLISEIEQSSSVEHLLRVHQRLPILVSTLLESGDKTENITRIITSVSDAICRQLIRLAIEELGDPPCRFAFMVMGSEGRKEQTLATDQDNAIVIEDIHDQDEHEVIAYFLKLGKMVCENLDRSGYQFCKGGIMAMNPKWTRPLSVWKKYFSDWIESGDPQSILDASIFFDFRFVYGDENLLKSLRNHVTGRLENKSVFYYHLAQYIVRYKPPLSLFGNIVGKSQPGDHLMLDLKKTLFPVTGFIRLYALYSGLQETNSLERLRKLHEQKQITTQMFEELLLSYNYLMNLRFRAQSGAITQNRPPNNSIDIHTLTHIEIATFKKVLSEMGSYQSKVNFDFKGSL